MRDLAAKKFELVKAGDRRRIEDTIRALAGQYDAAVSAVAPDAPGYATASRSVPSHLPALLP